MYIVYFSYCMEGSGSEQSIEIMSKENRWPNSHESSEDLEVSPNFTRLETILVRESTVKGRECNKQYQICRIYS